MLSVMIGQVIGRFDCIDMYGIDSEWRSIFCHAGGKISKDLLHAWQRKIGY